MTEVSVIPSAYWVSVLPLDHPDFHSFLVTVERVHGRDGEKWAVRQGGRCLSRSNTWDWEMQPSSRTDTWLRAHRFTEKYARAAAIGNAGLVVINGLRAIDISGAPAGRVTK